MQFEYILLAIFFNHLRKQSKKNIILEKWDLFFRAGLAFSIVMLVLGTTVPASRPFTLWISHITIIGVATLILKENDFKVVRSLVYTVLPLVIINFTQDLSSLISKDFTKRIDTYFQVATGFASIWFVAMLFINNKQRKSLEKERLKTIEREKEFHITEKLKAELEVQVAERTAALTLQKEQLEGTILELKTTQSQLIQAEKMASLGELTAGIAHEIQNPLNFVNNFSEVSNELIDEMYEELGKGDLEEARAIAADIKLNLEKINHHGKRADAIVKGMLQHSRSSSGIKEPTDINKLADEYLRLAYHGLRAKDKSFNATLNTDYAPNLNMVNIIPQDVGRVILNLITNAFYAVSEKKKQHPAGYEPTVSVFTNTANDKLEISVQDNGNGIPQPVLEKIFQPFFTTKPTGQGTGLGLSLSYDIVNAHAGEIKVATREGEGTTFTIVLPSR